MEHPYLPPAICSGYINNFQAAGLDRRQFWLTHEDLVRTVKEEFKDGFQIAAHQHRQLLFDPCIVDFGMKPEPHVVLHVSILS